MGFYRVSTHYYNADGKKYREHMGEPRRADVFERNSKDAVRIEVWHTAAYSGSYDDVFTKDNDGRWVGHIVKATNGKYYRNELGCAKTLMHINRVEVDQKLAERLLQEELDALKDYASKEIAWCKPEDEQDENGRYWLGAYRGCGKYRLIVKDGKIIGSIPNGREKCPFSLDYMTWTTALENAVAEKVTGEYHLLPAEGSGTYFYLCNDEDKQYLQTKEYDVPDMENGGLHHNIEVR